MGRRPSHAKRRRTVASQISVKTNYWGRAMGYGWSPERRAKQAEAIRQWCPWQQSTGPRSIDGKAASSRNAYKGAEWRRRRNELSELRRLLREQPGQRRALERLADL